MTAIDFWFWVYTLWTWDYEDAGGRESDPYADGGWSSDENLLDTGTPSNFECPGSEFPYHSDYDEVDEEYRATWWIDAPEKRFDPYDTD